MSLSSEDLLRLNVLVRNVEAVRIDEAAMTVYGLSPKGEAAVRLNPNCRDEQYLRRVREFLSSHALGSPGGYPVHLQRWTRTGHGRDSNLAALLMLGEPEAIMALVCAPGLSDELARRAWWVEPTTENACRMLEREAVVRGTMGRVLVDHLVEHLPFETEAGNIIRIVRLVLRTGLMDDAARLRIWAKGERQNVYRIGFLAAQPHDLPDRAPARADAADVALRLRPLLESGNGIAIALDKTLAASGQTFLRECEHVLRRPSNQDAVVALLDAIGACFADARQELLTSKLMSEILATLESGLDKGAAAAVLRAAPALRGEVLAVQVLAQTGERLVDPIFSHTTAEGTLMRTKLEPVSKPLFEQIRVLTGLAHG
jgi:hypothetical protein